MLERTSEKIKPMSLLALDLARSRVALAALKLQANMQPDQEELQSAAELRYHYNKQINSMEGRSAFIPEPDSEDTKRAMLQKSLAAIAPPPESQELEDLPALKSLVQMLSNLSNAGTLVPEEAGELWSSIQQMEAHSMRANRQRGFKILGGGA